MNQTSGVKAPCVFMYFNAGRARGFQFCQKGFGWLWCQCFVHTSTQAYTHIYTHTQTSIISACLLLLTNFSQVPAQNRLFIHLINTTTNPVTVSHLYSFSTVWRNGGEYVWIFFKICTFLHFSRVCSFHLSTHCGLSSSLCFHQCKMDMGLSGIRVMIQAQSGSHTFSAMHCDASCSGTGRVPS